MVVHYPPLGLIQSISLSYPTYSPPPPRSLIVGKSLPGNASSSAALVPSNEPNTPTKMTHRQKYEALIAATTRPAPYTLSASLFMGSIVRSDPLSGKTSKGFWGPGRGGKYPLSCPCQADKSANVHLRPQLDQSVTPSAIYLSPRSQTRALWGSLGGSCIHTTLATKSQSSQGGRAASINVISAFADSHEGEVCDIWMDDRSEAIKWVTGGTDGRVKYWQLVTTEIPRSGKRPADIVSSMICLFSSPKIKDTLLGRSEAVRRRQNGKPDDVFLVRCAPDHGVVCGITEDGDLRVWFGAGSGKEREVRIDAGSAEDMGVVKRMELEVRDDSTASVLVHHYRSSSFARFDINIDTDGQFEVTSRTFDSPVPGAFSAIQASLRPSLAITTSAPAPPVLSISGPNQESDEVSGETSPEPETGSKPVTSPYGRLVATGDEHGVACLWAWDEIPGCQSRDDPLRAWPAVSGRITAIEVSCGLVAVGRYVTDILTSLTSVSTVISQYTTPYLIHLFYFAAFTLPDYRLPMHSLRLVMSLMLDISTSIRSFSRMT